MKASTDFENVSTRLESTIDREFSLGHNHIRLVGHSSLTGLAYALSQSISKNINNLPHLVVVPRSSDGWRFQQALSFFDPQRVSTFLPHFEVSPYSGLYPKSQNVSERLKFLFEAGRAGPHDIFVAPVGSLQQLTLPFKEFQQKNFHFRKDDDLPKDIAEFLNDLGYSPTPIVEDVGQYSMRGGILDIFSPAHAQPVRLELFGETIESLRHFSVHDQRSSNDISSFYLIPAREVFWTDQTYESAVSHFRKSLEGRNLDKMEKEETLRSLVRKSFFPGIDFLLPMFFQSLESPLSYFSSGVNIWLVDPIETSRHADHVMSELRSDYNSSEQQILRPDIDRLYQSYEQIEWPLDSRKIELSAIDLEDLSEDSKKIQRIPYSTQNVLDLSHSLSSQTPGTEAWVAGLKSKLSLWEQDQYKIFIGVRSKSQAERLKVFLEKLSWNAKFVEGAHWHSWFLELEREQRTLFVVPRVLPESVRLKEEQVIFLRDEDLFGKKTRLREVSSSEEFQKKAKRLSFGDLKPGDHVVHILHGIGIYEGLKMMSIGGAESEYIQVAYKDKDKLYLPVYRVGQLQKYSGASSHISLDKLGGPGWEKTKSKVKSHLRDIANDLLTLYAKRAELHRPPFKVNEEDSLNFEASFLYDETEDQLRAINDLKKDMFSTKPMDRLICGDVGFGKTEVAMRAAFVAAYNKKQVAVLAPTTVLSFQHLETFRKRFKGWPFEIRELNRFVTAAETKKTIADLKEGKVDIVVGTHRLLSKDVVFKDLGLLVIDEEQKFGVTHKEKIRKLKSSVDTLAMSATPIPRTLNMSLVGIRDLSLINTAPIDRLPTRTFICKFDEETIRKAIESELARGGQIFFIHNRVQSIYGVADQIRQIVPQARIRVGHGQMDEQDLEKTMIAFFHHEVDILVCTTIVESGMDIPNANTMFIDQAHMFGLSQLYQLRGRVGRSKQRAYCYLILPKDKPIDKEAQERLKIIQEHTALGSGIHIAQYDLELRGAGNILGEEQSGHVNAVGYELYMDLLNEAVHQARGEPTDEIELDPEINLRIPALIPDSYIGDIRLRLSYYKALADISSEEELEKIEEEMRDQFGAVPEPVTNLMGLMLIRSQCKKLGVRDISAGPKNISLIFTEKTKLKPETVIGLAMRENKKYSLTPDNRLNIRMNTISWPQVYEELSQLLKLI